jgi:hypothetical protein
MNAKPQVRTLIAGAAIILAVNAIALAGAAWNRSGTPDSTLHLTQRELEQPYASQSGDDSGIALTLKWRVIARRDADRKTWPNPAMYATTWGEPAWLDEAGMKSLGFDTRPPPGSSSDYDAVGWQPGREVLLVLEQDGPAYRSSLDEARRDLSEASAESREYAKQALSEEANASRLFVVNAGLDAAALRLRYPDRAHYAVVRGRIRPEWTRQNDHWRLAGHIERLSVDSIHVPVAYRPVFQRSGLAYADDARGTGRFEAEVAFGKRLEPWITGIQAK